jgi:hypothetical protein
MSKPTNNRVMCPDCGKPKMLFESESKANNFIKWNGGDIETNGGELRAYFCPACGGYHITSKPFKPSYEHNTENLIERYKKDLKVQTMKVDGKMKCDEIDMKAEELLVEFVKELPKAMKFEKSGLRDLLDGWIKVNAIEVDYGVLSILRSKLYKRFNV